MIGNRLSLGLLFLGMSLTHCAPKKGAYNLERVQHQDTKPAQGQTFTQARVISLNSWASELLASTTDGDDFQTLANDYFARHGVTDAKPLSMYRLSLRTSEECFSDGGKDLWWTINRDEVRRQLESAAQFILDFHEAILGVPKSVFAFQEVELCPIATTGRKLYLVGTKLTIGIPRGVLSNYSAITSDKLMQMWNAGEQFQDDRSFFQKLRSPSPFKTIWLFANPIGGFRLGLRQYLAANGNAVAKLVNAFRSQVGKNVTADAISKDFGSSDIVPARMVGNFAQRLKQAETAQALPLFLENWECIAKSERLAEDLTEATMGQFGRSVNNEKNEIAVDIQAGLVAVGNYHRIGINFAAFGGPFDRYVEDGPLRERRTDVKAKVYGGLVSVFTIDDISVDAAFGICKDMSKGSVSTASADIALTAAINGEKLCK